MRRVAITLLCSLSSLAAMAQATQPCVVKQYNQKEEKTPLAGVEVMVSNAGSQVSDNDGRFVLSFRTLKPGDRVNLISAKKTGFEVFNSEAVGQWNISRDQTPFTLVLVKKEYFEQLKAKLTQTSTDSYKKKYEQAVRELERQKEAGKLKEDEFNRKYDELETQYQTQLSNLNNYIDQFARIDLSEVSAEEQRILEMVEDGEIDEAVKAYEALDISGKLRQARENKKALAEAKSMIEEEEARQEQAIKELKAKQEREIATLKLAGGKENYDKVGRMLKENALADTTDNDSVWKYAVFAYNQRDFKEAERFYHITLESYTQLFTQTPNAYRSNLATIQNNLGSLYDDLHDYAKSEEYYLQALENYVKLFIQDPNAYRADIAMTQNNLGNLYRTLQDYAKSAEYYLQALENRSILFAQNPDAYRADLATTQNSLGILYDDLHECAKSAEYYLQALENRIVLFTQNPDAHRADLASIQNNLGALYRQLHDYSKSEEYSLLALDNYTKLFTQNPDAYRADLAMIQNNLGALYVDLHDYAKSAEYFLQALGNRTVLFTQNPDACRADLALIQNNVGVLHRQLHDYSKSEEYSLQALKNYTKLFTQNPNVYRADLAGIQSNLGILYSDLHDYAKSEGYYLQALENRIVLFARDPDIYREDVASLQKCIGDLYYDEIKDYSKAEEHYLQSLKEYEVLYEKQPEAFRDDLAYIQYSLMYVYAKDDTRIELYDSMLDSALANYEYLYQEMEEQASWIVDLRKRKGWRYLQNGRNDEAIAILESVYAIDAKSATDYLAIAYNAKAYEYAKEKDYAKALETIDKAISVKPKEAEYYDSKGDILLMKGDGKGALKMWNKVIELDPDFLTKYPAGTELSNGLKEKGLIE